MVQHGRTENELAPATMEAVQADLGASELKSPFPGRPLEHQL